LFEVVALSLKQGGLASGSGSVFRVQGSRLKAFNPEPGTLNQQAGAWTAKRTEIKLTPFIIRLNCCGNQFHPEMQLKKNTHRTRALFRAKKNSNGIVW